jgi:hypothetical protein
MVQFAQNTDHKFEYAYAPVNDLQVVTTEDPKTGKPVVDHVLVQDEPIKDSSRFWTSLFARYGFNRSFFKYFEYAEVFNRISQVETNDRMRLCIERSKDEQGNDCSRLMAVSNPTKPLVVYDELMDLLGRYDGRSVNYSSGIVESTHTPRAGGNRFDILGDLHENRFVMQTPIDGYGAPNLYLALLREICTNGMVGYAKAFRSQLALGKGPDDVTPSLIRALDGFNNDEGYAAIRQRVESAGKSWLSVYESQQLYKLLIRLHSNKALDVNDSSLHKGTDIADYLTGGQPNRPMGEEEHVGSPIIKAFHKMTGDAAESYGLANLDSLSAKRQKTLPVNCKVYDAINFATEVATHYAQPEGGRLLQAWVGGRISDEYDMEGTCERFEEFSDFLVDAKMGAGLTGSEYAAGAAGSAASLN